MFVLQYVSLQTELLLWAMGLLVRLSRAQRIGGHRCQIKDLLKQEPQGIACACLLSFNESTIGNITRIKLRDVRVRIETLVLGSRQLCWKEVNGCGSVIVLGEDVFTRRLPHTLAKQPPPPRCSSMLHRANSPSRFVPSSIFDDDSPNDNVYPQSGERVSPREGYFLVGGVAIVLCFLA